MFTVNMHTERRDRGDSARLSCVSCGSGWSVPCVSIQLTLSQHELFHVIHGTLLRTAPRVRVGGRGILF